jgi:hypothetical protein
MKNKKQQQQQQQSHTRTTFKQAKKCAMSEVREIENDEKRRT